MVPWYHSDEMWFIHCFGSSPEDVGEAFFENMRLGSLVALALAVGVGYLIGTPLSASRWHSLPRSGTLCLTLTHTRVPLSILSICDRHESRRSDSAPCAIREQPNGRGATLADLSICLWPE